jgi:cell division protease FtsH
MSEFDKIIGYDAIKEELMQLCDMIHNTDIYRKLGAKMSRGLLLHGEPGVGKSLMAMSFIKESGRNSYIIRRNKHDGDFINEIKGVFSKAAQNAPSIILLDDMDKFVVEDKSKEEYVAVQACIDEVSSLDVYVIATANSIRDIPRSLLRAGRFDRKIRVYPPRGNDAEKIIRHYLESKSIISDVNFDDIAKMLIGRSCAELETIINEAAIYAGYERKEKLTMEHLVRSVLRIEYGVSDSLLPADASRLEKIAYHPPNHFKIPQQFEHFILANSLLIGNNEKSNENMGKNKDVNYEEHNSNNVFPDYETCDEMPKYEDWF